MPSNFRLRQDSRNAGFASNAGFTVNAGIGFNACIAVKALAVVALCHPPQRSK
jgi:hypothetical protein